MEIILLNKHRENKFDLSEVLHEEGLYVTTHANKTSDVL